MSLPTPLLESGNLNLQSQGKPLLDIFGFKYYQTSDKNYIVRFCNFTDFSAETLKKLNGYITRQNFLNFTKELGYDFKFKNT